MPKVLDWENYGDVSITEGWTLVLSAKKSVDKDISESFKGCYYILKNYYDCDGLKYGLIDAYVDVNESWIDRKQVMDYIGMTEETYDEIQYAIGCLDYHGYMNFGCDNIDYFDDIQDLIDYLKDRKGVDVEKVGDGNA